MPELIAAHPDGATSGSTRLPLALMGRFRDGESVTALASDYAMTTEQVAWGIELAALREVIAALPPKRRTVALVQAAKMLRGLRTYRLITSRRPWRVLFDSRRVEVGRG